jgi:hypothetical protein
MVEDAYRPCSVSFKGNKREITKCMNNQARMTNVQLQMTYDKVKSRMGAVIAVKGVEPSRPASSRWVQVTISGQALFAK